MSKKNVIKARDGMEAGLDAQEWAALPFEDDKGIKPTEA